MATTISTATITISTGESITLNGTTYGEVVTKSVTGVKNIFNRIITCPALSETVLYSTHASTVSGEQLDKDNIKYARITNEDSYGKLTLIIENAAGDEYIVVLGPGESWQTFTHLAAHESVAGDVTVVNGVVGAAAIACTDGDAADGMTNGQYIEIISYDGGGATTSKNYVLSDTNAGGVATGTVIAGSSDLGSDTATNLGAPTTNAVAMGVNMSSVTQAGVLTELKAAIEHANGHNSKLSVAAVSGTGDGAQTVTISQVNAGAAGNTVTTTNLTNITAPDFTSGADGTVSGADYLLSVNAIAQEQPIDATVLVASS